MNDNLPHKQCTKLNIKQNLCKLPPICENNIESDIIKSDIIEINIHNNTNLLSSYEHIKSHKLYPYELPPIEEHENEYLYTISHDNRREMLRNI